jgi:Domain of unknown function (DUF4287)
MKIIGKSPLTKTSELVNWAKTEYGHGHAMSLVHKRARTISARA